MRRYTSDEGKRHIGLKQPITWRSPLNLLKDRPPYGKFPPGSGTIVTPNEHRIVAA